MRRILQNLKVLRRKIWALVFNAMPDLVSDNRISLVSLEGMSWPEPGVRTRKHNDERALLEMYETDVGKWLNERSHVAEFELLFGKRKPEQVGSTLVRVLHIRFTSDVDLAVFKLSFKYNEYK